MAVPLFSSKNNLNNSKFPSYENTNFAIKECLKQFSDFTNAINEVCNLANVFGRSLQSLEQMSAPEIIGGRQIQKMQLNKFKNTPLLLDSLDTFCKIMLAFSDKIKTDAIDKFDNFIMQVVVPTSDEIEGVIEHNRFVVLMFLRD